MKINTFLIAGLLAVLFFSSVGSAANDTGEIPSIGNINGPATTADVTENLGVFAAMGKFILEYAVHIAIFVMVITVVLLSMRGSWARSNNKVDEAVDVQKNQGEKIFMYPLLFFKEAMMKQKQKNSKSLFNQFIF